jgi:hypothetical protein
MLIIMEDIKVNKKFDITKFKKRNKYGRFEFIDSNGEEVVQLLDDNFPSGKINAYLEYRKYPNSPYELSFVYDIDGNLVQSVKTFYGVLCENKFVFDKNGNVVSTENFDIHYKFSIPELIDKMKMDYQIDLLDGANNNISRYIEDKFLNIPIYEVFHVINNVEAKYKIVFLIDGNSGRTLYTTKRPLWKNDMKKSLSIVEEYFNSLNK